MIGKTTGETNQLVDFVNGEIFLKDEVPNLFEEDEIY